MNPKKMQKMMKQMGIKQDELPATEVIIKLEDKNLVIKDPQVSKVNMMGQVTYQVIGEAEEKTRAAEIEITEEEVRTVMEQTNCSEEDARKALQDTGDLTEAILELQ